MIITGRSLTRRYGSLEVLKGVDIDIRKGEVVALIGPSGAGKSTLLQILGTLDPPDSGSLEILGKDINKCKRNALADFRNRSLGFVFQFHHLLPEFSALENAMMPGLIAGMRRQEATEVAKGWLEKFQLGHRLEHKPAQLSGGEQQRVAVARALFMKPSIILADEPTGNLDSKNSNLLFREMVDLARAEQMTFLVATHQLSFSEFADRTVRMLDGYIVE